MVYLKATPTAVPVKAMPPRPPTGNVDYLDMIALDLEFHMQAAVRCTTLEVARMISSPSLPSTTPSACAEH